MTISKNSRDFITISKPLVKEITLSKFRGQNFLAIVYGDDEIQLPIWAVKDLVDILTALRDKGELL